MGGLEDPKRERRLQDPQKDWAPAPELRVLLISDGRPGHYRQSEGVVAALKRKGPVTTERLDLGLRLPVPKGLIPKLGRRLSPAWVLRLHGIAPSRLTKPDLIVSAGGATLGANVALARTWRVPNVFSGSTRGFDLGAFSLVLTPYLSAARAPVVVAGPKPTPFDPDRVPAPRSLRTPEDLRSARVALLVGGPTGYAAFKAGDWDRLRNLVEELARDWQCAVTIVTSPRTPPEAYQHLAPAIARHPDRVTLIDYRRAGAGSVDAALACDLVLITSDSMSMTTEAALSRRPAVSLAPVHTRKHRDDEAMQTLAANGWLATLQLSATGASDLARVAAHLVPMRDNHLDRLAGLVFDAISRNKQTAT